MGNMLNFITLLMHCKNIMHTHTHT